MLTKGDDYPIHQTAEPIAFAGTDRNFYDRYFFNAYLPDGSAFVAIAFGVYPHLNIADAHISLVRDGVQTSLHASRILNMERLELTVGPITIEVIEPLRRLKVTIAPEQGISAELVFEGRHFPIQEPRFIQRIGPRTFMDYTRLTQNCRVSGWVECDGLRSTFGEGAVGTRDRSWGVRPVGASDAQPHAPTVMPGFFWQWTPTNFDDRSLYFHINADAQGKAFNVAAAQVADGGGANAAIVSHTATLDTRNSSGTRWPRFGELTIVDPDGSVTEAVFTPFARFQMKGLGYVNPTWGHGLFHGELAVEREDWVLDALNPESYDHFHVQRLSRVELRRKGEPVRHGLGTFEQLILGPYEPMGFKGMTDLAE